MVTNKTLIKEENGVSMYKQGNKYSMYIEDIKVIEIDEQFKGMLDKSYGNLVKIRKQNSNT